MDFYLLVGHCNFINQFPCSFVLVLFKEDKLPKFIIDLCSDVLGLISCKVGFFVVTCVFCSLIPVWVNFTFIQGQGCRRKPKLFVLSILLPRSNGAG